MSGLTAAPILPESIRLVHLATGAKPIGFVQSWQDFSASRSFSVAYQNTSGRPIFVSVDVTGNDANYLLEVSADNVIWHGIASKSGNGQAEWASGLIPPGSYYRMTGTATVQKWMELR